MMKVVDNAIRDIVQTLEQRGYPDESNMNSDIQIH